MCTTQRIDNSKLDYLNSFFAGFWYCFYTGFMLSLLVFIMLWGFFVITQIYQIPWSSEVIHQEHWKADLHWILLGDLIWQAHIGIPKIRLSLLLSSSLHEGTQMPEPGNPLKISEYRQLNFYNHCFIKPCEQLTVTMADTLKS